MDAALTQARQVLPELPADSPMVDRVMARITPQGAKWSAGGWRIPSIDDVLAWLRPALSVAILAAVLTLVTQQTRDAIMITKLENRLKAYGNAVAEEHILLNQLASLFPESLSIQEEQEGTFFSPVPNAAITADPAQLIARGLKNLFPRDRGLLEELSRRYPGLAAVTLGDRVDARGKKILETEGRAFLKDFEQLIREGVQRP